jgi:hypothetical protein
MGARTRFRTQLVGALPAIVHYIDELGLAATIDRLVPREGEVPLGTLIEVPVANRLLQPKALFRVGPWAESAALTVYHGPTPAQLNDDRLGWALERLAAHAETAQAARVHTAIDRCGLDVTEVHYDLTTGELFGAYEAGAAAGSHPPAPRPTYGRTEGGRKHVEQIQLGLDVTGGGGVPAGHLPSDGNAGEGTSHWDNLKLLGRTLPRGKLLYISDTKLDGPNNLLAVAARKGQFLCGGAFSPRPQDRYLGLRGHLRPVEYFPACRARRPPGERDQYRAAEVGERLDGVIDGRPVGLDYRLVFVWSQAKARQEAATRERHVAEVRAEFEAVY